MQQANIAALKKTANELRRNIITMIYEAQSGHPGGSLSIADFITACYWHAMNVDPAKPRWSERDRFVLSKGHTCPAQYAALAMKGFFDMSVLSTLRKEGSILQGHPDMKKCPGIDISTGSLGQGFACAVGMALAAKLDGKKYRVFCAIGDGECNEGEIWEAAGNEKMQKMLAELWNGMSIGVEMTELDYALNSQKEHKRIFAALEGRDALAARAEMEKHILRSMEDALTYYL